jgi:hypothetical protein
VTEKKIKLIYHLLILIIQDLSLKSNGQRNAFGYIKLTKIIVGYTKFKWWFINELGFITVNRTQDEIRVQIYTH